MGRRLLRLECADARREVRWDQWSGVGALVRKQSALCPRRTQDCADVGAVRAHARRCLLCGLAARGIRLRKEGPVFNGALPLPLATPSTASNPISLPTKPFPNLTPHRWLALLARAATLRPTISSTRRASWRRWASPKPPPRDWSPATFPALRRELGDVEFTYQITRAYAWVAAKGRNTSNQKESHDENGKRTANLVMNDLMNFVSRIRI